MIEYKVGEKVGLNRYVNKPYWSHKPVRSAVKMVKNDGPYPIYVGTFKCGYKTKELVPYK